MVYFSDIFKSSFLEKMADISFLDMALAILFSLGLGIFILYIYKKTYQGVMYSSSFAYSLVAMPMVTSMLILAVTSNVVLSLGMVGALSIVRFRTAVKEPLDIVFLFWSISVGIVVSAGMIPLAVFGSVFIGIFFLLFINHKETGNPYILVISCANNDAVKDVQDYLKTNVDKAVLKSKTVQKGKTELNYEVRFKDENADFVTDLSELNNVDSAVLVSYNGDYMG